MPDDKAAFTGTVPSPVPTTANTMQRRRCLPEPGSTASAGAQLNLDQSSLVAFSNAAAGHEGVLCDPSGDLVMKPCTQAEIDFYESAARAHPEFSAHVPEFMGMLTQTAPQLDTEGVQSLSAAQPAIAPTANAKHVEHMHGRALDTKLLIVLENVTASFVKPNMLDVKLGARLWDEDAPAAKRARLDNVAGQTTSGSLGFRIAGMKVWSPKVSNINASEGGHDSKSEEHDNAAPAPWTYDQGTGYTTYNKLYGRSFTTGNVIEGFRDYIAPQALPINGAVRSRALELAGLFAYEVDSIRRMLEKEESRMYSASILFVYEGDADAYDRKRAELENARDALDTVCEDGAKEDGAMQELGANRARLVTDGEHEKGTDDEAEDGSDDSDDETVPKLFAVKLIDFAHAKWTPGEGADENSLQGIRNTFRILQQLEAEFSKAKPS